MVSSAIDGGNVQANNYFIAQKYVDTLKDITSVRNQKGIMLPMEVTGILGSVAGIAEIAKEAFKSKDDTPPLSGPWGEKDS